MKCPNCGRRIPDGSKICPECSNPIPKKKAAPAKKNRATLRAEAGPQNPLLHKISIIACWVIGIIAICYGSYKGYFWIRDYNVTRLYTRGIYTPTVSQITLANNISGHAIVYYGDDGDRIYIPELGYSVVISGGVARFEVSDDSWFQGLSMADVESAQITFTPILIEESGKQTPLPELDLEIMAPYAPLSVTSPEENGVTIYTSSYPVSLSVVPGSTVTINGEDVSSYMDTGGTLSLDVVVEPIGDNDYTILVDTPNHKQTRYEVTIFREAYEIDFELTNALSYRTTSSTTTISGVAEPGCYVTVDTPYVDGSLNVNMETGEFSFIVKYSSMGENGVRFRIQKEGRADAIVSFSVYYVPALSAYADASWKMDYPQLKLLFEQWHAQKFKCVGPIVDSFTDEEGQLYFVMDITDDDASSQQLIILQNDSSTTSPSFGPSYTAYADVAGRYMYNSEYYPLLIVRYLDVTTD